MTETEFDGKRWVEWHKVPADQRQMPEPADTLVEIRLMYFGKKIDRADFFDWEEWNTRHAIGWYRRVGEDEGLAPTGWTMT